MAVIASRTRTSLACNQDAPYLAEGSSLFVKCRCHPPDCHLGRLLQHPFGGAVDHSEVQMQVALRLIEPSQLVRRSCHDRFHACESSLWQLAEV